MNLNQLFQSEGHAIYALPDHKIAQYFSFNLSVLRRTVDEHGLCLRAGRRRVLTREHLEKVLEIYQQEPIKCRSSSKSVEKYGTSRGAPSVRGSSRLLAKLERKTPKATSTRSIAA